MKLKPIAVALTLGFVLAQSLAIAGGTHDVAPKHGGIVVSSNHVDYEIVAKPELLQIYMGDHGKPIKIESGNAKITLLNGSEKTQTELLPVAGKFEAQGSFKVAKGTKGIALVTFGGKTSTVRFAVK